MSNALSICNVPDFDVTTLREPIGGIPDRPVYLNSFSEKSRTLREHNSEIEALALQTLLASEIRGVGQ
jgi:hypothetical protein